MALWDRNNSKHFQWYFWTSACYILFPQFSLLSYIQHWQYFHLNYKCGNWSEEVPDSCPSQSQRQRDKSQTLAFLFWGQILVSWSCQRQVHKLHLLAQNIVSVPISLLVEFLNNFIYLFIFKKVTVIFLFHVLVHCLGGRCECTISLSRAEGMCTVYI